MRQLAALHYPWVPAAVLRYALRNDEAVARLHKPLLLVHGDQDALISPDAQPGPWPSARPMRAWS